MIGDAIYTHLKTIAGVTALVGTGDNARIYPSHPPQGFTPPAISYFTVATTREYKHRGQINVGFPLVQIDCWASTYDGAKDLADEVRQGMNTFVGSIASVTVESSRCVNERDLFEPDDEDYHIALEFEIAHREAA